MEYPFDLLKKLGPDYDYDKLAGALRAGLFDSNPEVKKQAESVVKARSLMLSASAKFASDKTAVTPAPENPGGFSPGMEYLKNTAAMGLAMANPLGAARAIAHPDEVTPLERRSGDVARQLTHDFTAGIISTPKLETPQQQAMFDMIVKPVTALGAMTAQGKLVVGALGYVTKLPKAGIIAEMIPERLREIGVGAVVMGAIDAARADGVPEHTSALDPSGSMAKVLADQGVPDRVALGLSGTVVGGLLGPVMMGFASGLEKAGTLRTAMQISAEDLPKFRDALIKAGVQIESDANRYRVAEALIKTLSKVTQNEKMGSLTADLLTRQRYIADALFAGEGTKMASDDARVLAGIFRNNPGGVSVATGITDVGALDELLGKLTGSNRPKFATIENINKVDKKATYTLPNGDLAFVQYRVEGNTLHVGFVGSTGGKGSVDAFTKSIGRDLMDRTGTTLVTGERISGARVKNARPGVEVKEKQVTLTRAQLGEDTPTLGMNVNVVKVQRGMTTVPYAAEGPETIIAASRKVGDRVFAAPMHILAGEEATKAGAWKPGDPFNDGFLTSRGRHVSRAEATQIAEKAGRNVSAAKKAGGIYDAKYDIPEAVKQTAPVGEVEISRPMYDVLITRPNYIYPVAKEATKETSRINQQIGKIAEGLARDRRSPGTTSGFLLTNGEAVRGGFDLNELASKLKVQIPAGADVEQALHRAGGYVKMEMGHAGEMPTMRLELPASLTQEQFNALGRSADALKFGEVTLIGHDGAEVVLKNPVGTQLQDAVASMVKPKSVKDPFSPELIRQYQKTGVFKGQAGVLNDGTPVEIQHKSGVFYTVRDPLLGKTIRIHPNRMTILPTTLTNEFQPSNLFMDALDDATRASFARVRESLHQGLGEPITKFRELREFANARGFYATKMKGTGVELESVLDGEKLQFSNLEAAVAHIRRANGPMPELTPDQMQRWLGGNRNLGPMGSHGQPPNFGEMIPPPTEVLFSDLEAAVGGRGPGVFGAGMVPTRGFFLDLDRKAGGATQLFRHFENLQSATTAKHNFIASWYEGSAPGMSKGVMPLKKIMKLAGKGANEEAITAWLEVAKGTAEHAALEAKMTTNEIKAAQELRKWYDALFAELGIEAEYVTNYAPRMRETNGKFGTLPADIWSGMGNDPRALPKAANFFADYYRDGTLDMYDLNAFRVAGNYLRAGSSNRFVAQAWRDAKDYAVLLNSSEATRAYAKPFADFLLATKGMEFAYQRKMLAESFRGVLEMLPGEGKIAQHKLDYWTNFALGLSYSSVMGARPALALRNTFQTMVTTWPIIGGGREGIFEAMGRAMTREGMAAAIADRAIDVKGMVVAHQAEALGTLPEALQRVNEAGMYMYTSADHFTRATSYWAGRLRAEKALLEFAEKAKSGTISEAQALKLRRNLIRDSGMLVQDEQVQAEFLRRAASDPQSAAGFAGKQLSDVTNFLYGRGMQAKWMRSVPGRLLGQFGSWSMWYVDYLRRATTAMVRNGYKTEAAAFLARNALINGAIVAVGQRVLDVDLSRWAGYGSVFYSGGPALQLVSGVSTVMRGAGSMATGAEDPLAKSRVSEGIQMITQLAPNAIPFYYGARDAVRLATADDPVERLAAALSTKPTREYQLNRAFGMITGQTGGPFTASEADFQTMLNGMATGNQRVVNLTEVDNALSSASHPAGALPGNPLAAAGAQPSGQTQLLGLPKAAPKAPSQLPNEVVKPAESRPIQQY